MLDRRSHRHDQLYECSGKFAHASYAEAERVARKSKRGKSRRNVNLAIYRCAFCRRWHIGSAPKARWWRQ